jgi:hypothetical protein
MAPAKVLRNTCKGSRWSWRCARWQPSYAGLTGVAFSLLLIAASPSAAQLAVSGLLEDLEPRCGTYVTFRVSFQNTARLPIRITGVEVLTGGFRRAAQDPLGPFTLLPGQHVTVPIELEAVRAGETTLGANMRWTFQGVNNNKAFELTRARVRETWLVERRDALLGSAAILLVAGFGLNFVLERSRRRWEERRQTTMRREEVVQKRIDVVGGYIRDHYSQILGWAYAFCHEVDTSSLPLSQERTKYLAYLLAKLMWMEDRLTTAVGGYFFRNMVGEGVLTELTNEVDDYIIKEGRITDAHYSAIVKTLGAKDSFLSFRDSLEADTELNEAYGGLAACLTAQAAREYVVGRIRAKWILLQVHIGIFNEAWYEETVEASVQEEDKKVIASVLDKLVARGDFRSEGATRYKKLLEGYLITQTGRQAVGANDKPTQIPTPLC